MDRVKGSRFPRCFALINRLNPRNSSSYLHLPWKSFSCEPGFLLLALPPLQIGAISAAVKSPQPLQIAVVVTPTSSPPHRSFPAAIVEIHARATPSGSRQHHGRLCTYHQIIAAPEDFRPDSRMNWRTQSTAMLPY